MSSVSPEETLRIKPQSLPGETVTDTPHYNIGCRKQSLVKLKGTVSRLRLPGKDDAWIGPGKIDGHLE